MLPFNTLNGRWQLIQNALLVSLVATHYMRCFIIHFKFILFHCTWIMFNSLVGLKDWAEILQYRKEYAAAETKIRQVLELLEDKDSDALFSLGQVLSEQNKDDESIEAYTKSVQLNADDVELCYNLAIKYGTKGDTSSDM